LDVFLELVGKTSLNGSSYPQYPSVNLLSYPKYFVIFLSLYRKLCQTDNSRFLAYTFKVIYPTYINLGHAVAQLVEALLYKPEGRGFGSRWCQWNFLLTQSFRPHYDSGVESVSNRNEYQEISLGGKDGRCVGLKTLPLSCAECLEM
jgi:hypothetical protein